MLTAGHKQKQIAQTIDKSVVSREIRRNADSRNQPYKPELAQRKYEKRLSSKPKPIRFTPELQQMVEAKLSQKLSPEQIVGVCQKEGVRCVSHERIY